LFVDSFRTFFSSKSLINALETGNDQWSLIAEKLGITLTADDLDIVNRANAIRKSIIKKAGSVIPDYPFVAVPAGWSVETHLDIGKQRLGRLKNSPHGDLTHHHMTLTQAHRLWRVASKYWTGKRDSTYVSDVASARGGRLSKDSVEIGCQTIRRYELEQLALHQGWDFPE
jgi:hypothetical protein